MASKLKEEDKNEKAIRTLLRNAPNRRCINCNSLGPQYVCLTFWTFVCTQCSGIHREFTHRVKSVSMSKFTSQEVGNLENGGNERAREIYFKDWDPQRRPLPDSSDVDRLRDFIRMVYVERRLSGERTQGRGGDEETRDNRRPESRPPPYRGESRSPYEERYEERPAGGRRSNAASDRRFDERGTGYDEKRSPARFENERNRNYKNYQENRRSDEWGMTYDEKRSPARFETDRNRNDRSYQENHRFDERGTVYDERKSPSRFEMDKNRNERNYQENRDVDEKLHKEGRYNEGVDKRFDDRFASDRGSRKYGGGSPPPIRSVKEILGDDVPPLRVEIKKSQTNGSHETGKSHGLSQDGHVQRTGSSSSVGSGDGSSSSVPPSIRREEPTSLIDFSADPEPSIIIKQSDPFELGASIQSSADTSNITDWASFDMFPTPATGPSPPTTTLPPLSAPMPSTQGGGIANQPSQVNGNMQWAPLSSAVQSSSDTWSVGFGQPSKPVANAQPWNAFEANSSTTNTVTAVQTMTVKEVASTNQPAPFGVPTHSGATEPWSTFPGNSGTANSVPAAHIETVQEIPSVAASLPSISSSVPATNATSVKSIRTELPEDLFAGGPQISSQFTGFPPVRPHYLPMAGMNVVMGGYHQPQLSKSINPFDLPGDASVGPPHGEFLSMNSMQIALPNLNMQSMSLSGPASGGYAHQLGSVNPMFPGQAMYAPSHGAPSVATSHFIKEQIPNSTFPTMQSNGPGMPGSIQNTAPFLGPIGGPFSNYVRGPNTLTTTQSSLGGPSSGSTMNPNLFLGQSHNSFASVNGADSFFPLHGGQGANQSSLVAPPSGSEINSNLFHGERPVGSQNSFTSVNATNSLSPLHGGQQFALENTFRPLGSMSVLDTQFHGQSGSHFPPDTSLPVGNPFG